MDYDAYDAILHHIFKQTQGDAWFKSQADNIACGVCLRVEPGHFRVFPYENPWLEPFHAAITVLNPEVSVKLRSAAVHASLAAIPADQDHFFVDRETRIQVLETMDDLASAEKEQCAAFIRDERVLVVWADRIDDIIPSCNDFEQRLIKLVWRERPSTLQSTTVGGTSSPKSSSRVALTSGSATRLPLASGSATRLPLSTSRSSFSPAAFGNVPPPDIEAKFKETEGIDSDIEKASFGTSEDRVAGSAARPTRIYASVYIGLATALAAFFVGNGVNIIVREFTLDGNFMHFVLLVTAPLIFCVSLFFCIQLINTLSFVVGPIAHYRQNSKYYSALPPAPIKLDALPHVTVQMPVYKESLEATITPSIESIKKAMLTYARQGGTSSIFICDDGMQLLSDDDREKRMAFYAHQGIGWVARPKHSDEKDGFKRAGRFKKASNMNFGLALSRRMEELILELEQDPSRNPFGDSDDELEIEEKALRMAVDETHGTAWASGGRALRMGEIILLVDSDTLVPEDCFRDAARELAECPEVAIIQHESDVMQVAHHYFENGVAYFTRRINHCISAATANGEIAPFVGHNAFLRWTAVQDAAFVDPADNRTKFWSEAHVSEDFDMSLRLQLKGYVIRWATYSNGGFKEGVSLTCDDELNRWMKYAYGCSELLFNPLHKWIFKTPITREIHRFIWSSVPLHYKISMLSYMFSYYGIAGAFTLSLINYLLLGFAFPVDGYYMRSWEMWLAVTIVFVGAGNIGITMLDYRLYNKNLLSAFWSNVKWIPFFFFFFGGLSLHLSGAILAHLFHYNMTWSATKKEVEITNFFKEFPRITKRFWLSLTICFITAACMIILSTSLIPIGWRITGDGWAVIFPLAIQTGCHILYPIVLNPWLMIFSY